MYSCTYISIDRAAVRDLEAGVVAHGLRMVMICCYNCYCYYDYYYYYRYRLLSLLLLL